MHTLRFRDPAGAVREGTIKEETISSGGLEYSRTDVEILPPSEPTKLIGVGLNYLDHAAEMDKEPPDRPRLFFMPPSAVAGHGDTIQLPVGKERVDYEAELGVVIGKQCRSVSADDAMAYVKGYTCFNDISNRDDQRIERNYVRGKGFDGAAPFGPYIASPDEVPDDAEITSRIDGDVRQSSSIDQMIFSVPELIEEITTLVTLEPGDVIATGTPPGVGGLVPGNEVEIEIDGIGVLKHSVR